MIDKCSKCRLGQRKGVQVVNGRGPLTGAVAVLVGEAPGEEENAQGRPFVGLSGCEQDNYIRMAGGNPRAYYITNVVRCNPEGNRDPKPDEIAACAGYLFEELQQIQPRVIGAVGAFAARWFLGPGINMEYVHGIPIHITQIRQGDIIFPLDTVVVPLYHPSYGLHSTRHMTFIKQDYQVFVDTIHGIASIREIDTDDSLEAHYAEVTTAQEVWETLTGDWRYVAVDTEDRADGTPLSLQYSVREKTGYYISADNTTALKAFVEATKDKIFVIQNAPHDLPVMSALGITVKKHYDTMIMAYLLQDEPRGLKALGYRHCRYAMKDYKEMIRPATLSLLLQHVAKAAYTEWEEEKDIKKQSRVSSKAKRILTDYRKNPALDVEARWKNISTDYAEATLGPMPIADLSMIVKMDAVRYACRDADATLRIFHYLLPRIKAEGLERALDIDIAIQPILAEMMDVGLLIDREYFRELSTYFDGEMQRLTDAINTEYQKVHQDAPSINPASPKQIGEALCAMGLLPSPNTSTAEEELKKRAHRHPIINMILDFREVGKLKGTYSEALSAHADTNNRIHAWISQITTATGRLATSKPNIQNIPNATETGRRIKEGFIALPGCKLVSSDYSQVEMRVLAHLSRDPRLIDIFLRGVDIHAQTAAWIWGIPIERVTKDQRYKSKRIGFGIVYRISAFGLHKQLVMEGIDITKQECQQLIWYWYDIYKGVQEYMRVITKEAISTHMVRTFTGRLRRIPETYSKVDRVVAAGIRQACNAPIQGGAGDIIKIAMAKMIPVYKAYQHRGVCVPVDQIHDDLMDMVADDILYEYVRVKNNIMENSTRLVVPLKVDHKAGPTWARLEKLQLNTNTGR